MEQGLGKQQTNQMRGVGLDTDVLDINENNINYINYNAKLVEVTDVDELEMAYIVTTGHYLSFVSPYENKKIAVIPLPIRMQNG